MRLFVLIEEKTIVEMTGGSLVVEVNIRVCIRLIEKINYLLLFGGLIYYCSHLECELLFLFPFDLLNVLIMRIN